LKKYLLLVAFSFALEGFGYVCLVRNIEPFRYFFYATSWWSFIVLADTVLAARKGALSFLNRRLPLIICVSCGYWCLFEALNVRLRNWHYAGLPTDLGLRYLGYLLSYATVIPAVCLTSELLGEIFPGKCEVSPFRVSPRYPFYAVSAGFLALVMILIFPVFTFPLAWIFLTLLADGWSYRRGYPSFAGELESGSFKGLVTGMSSGLVCGVIWEAWNYRAVSKWIYTVPFIDGSKVFEMPLAGYAGFLGFGIETIAFVNLLDGLSKDWLPPYVLAIIALAFSFAVFPLIDRFTIISFAPAIYR
jgi:hypothetical protein